MKIIGLDVYEHLLSYAHGQYAMSGGRVATHQVSTLVRVRTDEGIDGWGECCPLGGTYLPDFPNGVRAAIAELGPGLLGLDPCQTAVVRAQMNATLLGAQGGKSAVDIACWDILGKTTNKPVSMLLGGVLQEDFPLYEAVPLAEPHQMAEFIAARREAGITCFQVKVGNDPRDDARRAAAAVEAAGQSRVICDANGGWRLNDAIIAARAMADLPIYLEQPCRTTADSARVRHVTALPLVMDETVVTPADLYDAKAQVEAGAVNLKLGRLGGIGPLRLMRDLAVGLGMTVSIEDTWGGDIVTAAVAHLAANTAADDLLSVSFFNDWTNEHVATVGPTSHAGRGRATTAPGLGVEVDLTALGEPLFTIS
ncbi:mandelate racemase/muconate lactonizing enzyme family protein [Saccharopolyspora phatthalungensis]|uniref:L-alanine-DL-glutamate epimerase-like enolase superfamily enzyme n=1 Tax=Saccharopolyspora phatthalungensis TaxID=664693 RepID=A0A840QIE2_9PSEU|nr:mandelate racemase/muconate lactonizing enzyme family protein [Saccharopolyspora phatthalungensis]MBB5157153.1 L-alanine-DL-glutamate epimerase-like enolase superfamily enzyme [Saccharopolyspora phatthalungensis]